MGVMLDRWGEKYREIENILELLNDLEDRKIITWNVMQNDGHIRSAHPRTAVCDWFDIDLKKLEHERRELLEQIAEGLIKK